MTSVISTSSFQPAEKILRKNLKKLQKPPGMRCKAVKAIISMIYESGRYQLCQKL